MSKVGRYRVKVTANTLQQQAMGVSHAATSAVLDGGEVIVNVIEQQEASTLPKTGQNTVKMAIVLMLIMAISIGFTLISRIVRKKSKEAKNNT
jgi:LPXTG-motif cell wall-anchored protein